MRGNHTLTSEAETVPVNHLGIDNKYNSNGIGERRNNPVVLAESFCNY